MAWRSCRSQERRSAVSGLVRAPRYTGINVAVATAPSTTHNAQRTTR
jgi:hypothetical protein